VNGARQAWDQNKEPETRWPDAFGSGVKVDRRTLSEPEQGIGEESAAILARPVPQTLIAVQALAEWPKSTGDRHRFHQANGGQRQRTANWRRAACSGPAAGQRRQTAWHFADHSHSLLVQPAMPTMRRRSPWRSGVRQLAVQPSSRTINRIVPNPRSVVARCVPNSGRNA